jgi:hypothetical protein
VSLFNSQQEVKEMFRIGIASIKMMQLLLASAWKESLSPTLASAERVKRVLHLRWGCMSMELHLVNLLLVMPFTVVKVQRHLWKAPVGSVQEMLLAGLVILHVQW